MWAREDAPQLRTSFCVRVHCTSHKEKTVLNRITTALAIATVAGFLAAGPAMAADDDGVSRGEGYWQNEGHEAGQWASNVGGELGVTNVGMHASGWQSAGGYRFDNAFDFDNDND